MRTEINEQAQAVSVYNSPEFFHSLQSDISETHASDRIAICTMSFEPNEPITAALMQELSAAALRGAEVNLVVDSYTVVNPGRLGPFCLPALAGEKARRRRVGALEDMARSNVTYSIVNPPVSRFSNVLSGRSHLKIFTVNDRVYLGGPNLEGTERADVVAGIEDADLADWLREVTRDIGSSGDTRRVFGSEDITKDIDSRTQVLIDAGKKNQSVILEQAVDMIDKENERIVIGSQWFPVGPVAERLLAASKRGAEVNIVYNHPSRHGALAAAHWCINAMYRLRGCPRQFFANQAPLTTPAVHGTALATTSSAIVTGHNFVETGVKLGTAEIGLARKDEAFARQVSRAIMSQVRPTISDQKTTGLLEQLPA